MVATHNVDFNADPYGSRTTDSDTALSSIQVLTSHPGLDVTITPGDSISHLVEHGPLCGSLVMNTDSSCDRTTDPDIVVGSSQDRDITMAPDARYRPLRLA